VALIREALLDPSPNIDADRAQRCMRLQALANPVERKYLSQFLIDFTWASSLLEGSSYSELDTEALVRYGARKPDKPVEDALPQEFKILSWFGGLAEGAPPPFAPD